MNQPTINLSVLVDALSALRAVKNERSLPAPLWTQVLRAESRLESQLAQLNVRVPVAVAEGEPA